MASFLTNAKMHPALAARVEASARGRRSTPGDASSAASVRALIRLVVVVVVASVGAWVFVTWRRESARIEGERALIIDIARGHDALLTDTDRGAFDRDATWLAKLAGPYEGDLVASELAAPGVFDAMLARPAVYVHGPVDSFGTPPSVADAAVESVKDSFLLCLVDPPQARSEKVVLDKVRVAYGVDGALEQATPDVMRLADARAALRVLSPEWRAKVGGADSSQLGKLHAELDRAPIESGKRALKAGLMIAVMDEHGPATGPSELDGERAHLVRVAIVDVVVGRTLLRLRRRVDPADWSERSRTTYARGLDECGLAFDVRSAAVPAAKP